MNNLLLSWQDASYTIGGIIFTLALLPSLMSEHKPHWKSSIITATVLTWYVVVNISLGLLFGAVTGATTALIWWALFFQAIIKNHNSDNPL